MVVNGYIDTDESTKIVVRGPHLASPMAHVFFCLFFREDRKLPMCCKGYPMFCKGMNMKNGCHQFVKQCTKYPGFWTDLLFPRNTGVGGPPNPLNGLPKNIPKRSQKNWYRYRWYILFLHFLFFCMCLCSTKYIYNIYIYNIYIYILYIWITFFPECVAKGSRL